jgi:D-erythronate 2-dehydrogenase
MSTVLITGAAGFLGQRLTHTLLERGTLAGPDGQPRTIDRLVLADVAAAPALTDPRVVNLVGDVADPAFAAQLVDIETTSIFHLAAIVSGMAEADFDLGMRINVDGSRLLLDVCRGLGHQPTFVFASSIAVYGGELPAVVLDTTALKPQTSYGTEKAIVDLLVGDYSRRGFVDGRVLRLPTISVRPGKPNAAASGFISGIIREPLNGETAVCPVDPGTRVWILSPSRAIDGLIAGHDMPARALGIDRTVNLPGLSVTIAEMAAALERVAGPEVSGRIRWERDPRIERMVMGWPGRVDTTRATDLGFPADESLDEIIRAHIAELRRGQ